MRDTAKQDQITQLRKEMACLRTQHVAELIQSQQIAAKAAQNEQSLRQQTLLHHQNRQDVTLATEHKLTQFRHAFSELRRVTVALLQAFQVEIQACNRQIHILITNKHADPDRITELTKIEAFDIWIQRTPQTEEQIYAQTLLQRVSAKLNHTLKSLKAELHQTTEERDQLQATLEQQEEQETNTYNWEKILGFEKIDDPANIIKVTMSNLPPPISISQYYQAYKPMILKTSNLPDIRNKSRISKEQFQLLWQQANSAARDLLIFMWVLKDLLIPCTK